ncbi:hypoxanthine phosphoribosyltransferase [bacterium]|nr:hypoxanthine phosphoribosyltransferase [bacterium]|tara:strand:- start:63206 stop:63733 length:528 start_codon:yes stop_codon:yes gene_type:complete
MNKIGEVLFSESEILERVNDIAQEINNDYVNKNICFISILKGSFMFASDLMKQIKPDCEMDFLSISEFEGKSSTGQVQIKKDIDISIEGKHVILLENITNTGLTLNYLKKMLLARGPASVKIACFLKRSSIEKENIKIDYQGFQIKDNYLVGYGLDINQKFRNLKEIRHLQKVRK